MVLSDQDIFEEIKRGELFINPYRESSIQPASYDLHLGNEFIEFKESEFNKDMFDKEDEYIQKCTILNDAFYIYPLSFVLATTEEWISLPPHLTAFIEGRSSVGRKGLFIHNAGYIDPGFEGRITLELFNATNRPITVPIGMRICQMVIMTLTSPAENPYEGKYQGQHTVTESKLYKDKENNK